ncbi:hypothetical protein LDENG_00208090 [Lucifuga dentata]|nr:hypothetical protein LDENG_00208090 [Lucifuga dentata]
MKRVYYNPAHLGSFGGVERLHQGVENETGKKVRLEDVREFLSEQDAYTLHKLARTHFTRNRVFVPRPLKQFQADLCDMQALAEHNDRFNYLVTVIDVFSKKAYVCVLKRKTAGEVVRAFESIFKDSQTWKSYKRTPVKNFSTRVFRL